MRSADDWAFKFMNWRRRSLLIPTLLWSATAFAAEPVPQNDMLNAMDSAFLGVR